MTESDWKELLQRWSDAVLAMALAEDLPAEVRSSGWLGHALATDVEIAKAEKRLKIELPLSYRSFLRVTNGWRTLNEFVKQLLPVREINWARKLTPEVLAVPTFAEDEAPDEDYFNYAEPSIDYRAKHMKETLQISDYHDALVLLNPQVIDASGEWEAWFFAHWIPGAYRYRSFGELMEAQYHALIGEERSITKGSGELPTEYVGSPGSARRSVKKRTPPGPKATTEELLSALADARLARKLFPKVKGGMYGPSPELAAKQRVIMELGRRRESSAADPLLRMLESPTERFFLEHELMQALARIGDPRVPDMLDRFISNDEGNLASAAIEGMMIANPARARESALRLLAEHGFMSSVAANYLGQMKETRAIPILLDVARDISLDPQLDRSYAAQSLAQFGTDGFEALVDLARSPEVSVRRLAVLGLMYCRGQPVHETLEALEHDSDAEIRESAQVALKMAGPRRKPS